MIPDNHCSHLDQIYLAFDIHEVLAQANAKKTEVPLFQAYGMLLKFPVEGVSKPVRHYVYPFVKELFQLLAETQGIHIAFYTSSKDIVAKPFVKQLLIQSLGPEKYAAIADQVHFCAKEQLRDFSDYERSQYSRHSVSGNQKKDLDDVYPHSNIPEKQRVLIDNDRSFAAPHQIKNLLNVSGQSWTRELGDYQYRGYGLHFCSSFEEFEKQQNTVSKVIPGKSIALYAKEQTFVIVYDDVEGRKELELSLDESAQIQKLHERHISENLVGISRKHCSNNTEEAIVMEVNKIERENPSKFYYVYICGEGVSLETCVKRASSEDIVIHLGNEQNNDANIFFPENPEVAVSLKDLELFNLIKLAREHWKLECSHAKYFAKESNKETAKAALYDLIWDKVQYLVWKEKIIHEANHVLLLTGAIFSAWEESIAAQKPLTKVLFNWQCKGEKKDKQFEWDVLEQRTDLYVKGLELLRRVNPSLEPITVKSFEAALLNFPTLPDDGAKEIQDGCTIS